MRSPLMPWLFAFLYHVQMRQPLWDNKAEFLGTSTHKPKKVVESLKRTVLYNILVVAILYKLSPPMILFYLGSVYLTWVLGFYLFFIQHAHEGSVFEKSRNWDHEESAIKGSSYLKTNRLVEYFICSINYHHVHHYDPSIPNYLLKQVHEEKFKDDPRVHILQSFSDIKKCFDTNLWDTKTKKWVKNYN